MGSSPPPACSRLSNVRQRRGGQSRSRDRPQALCRYGRPDSLARFMARSRIRRYPGPRMLFDPAPPGRERIRPDCARSCRAVPSVLRKATASLKMRLRGLESRLGLGQTPTDFPDVLSPDTFARATVIGGPSWMDGYLGSSTPLIIGRGASVKEGSASWCATSRALPTPATVRIQRIRHRRSLDVVPQEGPRRTPAHARARSTGDDARSHRGGMTFGVLAMLVGASPAGAETVTQTFTYTGAEQTFTVPSGISSVHVTATGAA